MAELLGIDRFPPRRSEFRDVPMRDEDPMIGDHMPTTDHRPYIAKQMFPENHMWHLMRSNGTCVATFWARDSCETEARLAARAMNALPDLLAACEVALDGLEDVYDGAPDGGCDWMVDLMGMLRETVAKAKGTNDD